MRTTMTRFMKTWRPMDAGLRNQILAAREALPKLKTPGHRAARLRRAVHRARVGRPARRADAAARRPRAGRLRRRHRRDAAPICAGWPRWRCRTACAAIRWTRRARPPAWPGRWRRFCPDRHVAIPDPVTALPESPAWARVRLALMALAVDPAGLGGLWLRARVRAGARPR